MQQFGCLPMTVPALLNHHLLLKCIDLVRDVLAQSNVTAHARKQATDLLPVHFQIRYSLDNRIGLKSSE